MNITINGDKAIFCSRGMWSDPEIWCHNHYINYNDYTDMIDDFGELYNKEELLTDTFSYAHESLFESVLDCLDKNKTKEKEWKFDEDIFGDIIYKDLHNSVSICYDLSENTLSIYLNGNEIAKTLYKNIKPVNRSAVNYAYYTDDITEEDWGGLSLDKLYEQAIFMIQELPNPFIDKIDEENILPYYIK